MTTRTVKECDRCGAIDKGDVAWATLGELDLCPRCIKGFHIWLSKAKTTLPGRAAGGRARADKLTPERRQEISKLAAQTRWSKA